MENLMLLFPLANINTVYHHIGIKSICKKSKGGTKVNHYWELQRNQLGHEKQLPSLTKSIVGRVSRPTSTPSHPTQLQNQGREKGAQLWTPAPKTKCCLAQRRPILTFKTINDHFYRQHPFGDCSLSTSGKNLNYCTLALFVHFWMTSVEMINVILKFIVI